jgi:outer membrane protein OmpA-like peptidoglycan-associated protein
MLCHDSQVTKVTWVAYQTLSSSPELSETRANVISHDNFIPEDSSMRKYVVSICVMLLAGCAFAQQDATAVEPMAKTPVFRVKVVSRTTKAVNYRHRGGSTPVDFKGTSLMPEVSGKGKVDSKAGRLEINADFAHLAPASKFGPQYLTYVLWAVTPEGRSVNLGEVVPNNEGKFGLEVTTDLQAFGMVVTAEPYFSVTRPSNLVVVENIIRYETKGFEEAIDARFDMLEGGQYIIDVPAAQLPSSSADPKTPLDLLEARNAVAIAKAAGASQYAADSLSKAQDFLDRAEDYLRRKQGRTPIGTAARGATQMAEDARVLTLEKKQQERVAAEKRAMQDAQAKAEADAKAASEAEAQAKAQAEEDARRRTLAEADREAAEKAKTEAEQQQAQADAARAAALAEQQRAQDAAEKARLAADEATRQKEEMRARLLKALNQVLETKDTDRGLVVNMPDVLFDSGQYTLKPAARERLARISGIVGAYPDLKFEVEGHTDSIGSEEFNQKLSEKRAGSVRDYLVDSGVSINNVVARGLGKTHPVADNTSAQGRKLNRRVEMIVSGDVIGTPVGNNAEQASPAVVPVSQRQ